MEAMGIRDGLRATTELQALGFHQRSSKDYRRSFADKGLAEALHDRDSPFADYGARRDPPAQPA
jgi:enoyl-CoA hydratase